MDQFIGKMLDNRYEILDVVGTGGMAVVYKARCHRLNRLVAVKILKKELAQDAELRRRFHDESQAVAMLSHPNIVAVYDVSKSDDVEYIVMELIDGITLKQYMQQRGGSLPWREALHFITQIVKALGHAHSRGIIHRDIKPHNIMVLRDGSVKVADFGIARFTASQNTLTQEALGSVHYISPEQARGSHIDARSDLYSAGVVLYEMLTGRLPYEGDSPVAVAIQHINSIPLSPRELDPEIPEALEEITMKAMASDPANRYPNADAMLADLEEFRKNPNISFDYTMERLPVDDGVDEPTRRRPAAPMEAEERPTQERPRRREPEPEEEEEERSAGKGFYIAAIVAVLIFVFGVGTFLYSHFIKGMGSQTTQALLVPNVVGMDWEALQSQEDAYADYWEDFTYQLEKYTSSDTVDQGKIISQDPVQGTSVTGEKTTVSVTVSSGPETGQMLDVVGMTTSDARLALAELREKYGLRITTVSENSDTIDKELVCRTDPEAGFDLQKGDTVTLYISLGSTVKQLSVPDFTTMTKDGVSRALSTLKLNVEYMDDVPSDKPEGTIVYQSIAEGTMVDEGTTIILQASSGPQETTTPEEPTQSPESNQPDEPTPPSASTSVTRYWRTELHMPQASEGDSGSVHVTVTVDGTVVEESDFARDGSSHTLEIPGQGTQRVTIYLDGEQLNSQDVNFDVEGVIIE